MGALSTAESIPGGTRTRNLEIRSLTPYPLGHGDLRQPGVEPGPRRWQRRILTVELLAPFLVYLVRAPGIEPGTYSV